MPISGYTSDRQIVNCIFWRIQWMRNQFSSNKPQIKNSENYDNLFSLEKFHKGKFGYYCLRTIRNWYSYERMVWFLVSIRQLENIENLLSSNVMESLYLELIHLDKSMVVRHLNYYLSCAVCPCFRLSECLSVFLQKKPS